MKMEHYLCHTDYPIWQVIQNGNGHISVTTNTNGMIKVLPPKISKEVVARERERKARTTLLMALPEYHLAKFHKMVDAKETTTTSSSNTQNVAFVSANNISNTNDVSTAYSVSSPSVSKSHREGSSSYTDKVIHSFLLNQSSAPQLDFNDLEQINDDDMEEIDLKWQVAIISMRIEKFYERTGRKLQFDTKDLVGYDKTKVECFNCHKMGYMLVLAWMGMSTDIKIKNSVNKHFR
uniref:Ribonuclease H-like domain-containing protein n=1 Tax=Tanacetum cinerariifolium TaxID=118510 RepID=A0A699I8J8_TANCI|nr:ribonuclease H-like domain-containing protein [Tanacetum cinerariifolium]